MAVTNQDKFLAIIALLVGFLSSTPGTCEMEFGGRLSGWVGLERQYPKNQPYGVRYLPYLRGIYPLFDGYSLDSTISPSFLARYGLDDEGKHHEDGEVKAHRVWLRLMDETTEVRIGMQRIDFGAAKVLRPLQWFDTLDPQDPTGFSPGVKGLLIRNYFAGDINLWLWTLYGNELIPAISPYKSLRKEPEFGGRLQISYPSEVGLSLHQRIVEFPLRQSDDASTERKIALDGFFDLGVGLWFEAMWVELAARSHPGLSYYLGTLGIDYTLPWGNGVYTSLEAMGLKVAQNSYSDRRESLTAALNISYSLNLLERLRLYGTIRSDSSDKNIFFGWQRSYDDFLIDTSLFYAKIDQGSLHLELRSLPYGSREIGSNDREKKGLKILLQYNH